MKHNTKVTHDWGRPWKAPPSTQSLCVFLIQLPSSESCYQLSFSPLRECALCLGGIHRDQSLAASVSRMISTNKNTPYNCFDLIAHFRDKYIPNLLLMWILIILKLLGTLPGLNISFTRLSTPGQSKIFF